MLSWSPREAIAAWWDDCRGQTEPIAAIVAVLAVGVGLALYAGVAAEQEPGEPESTDAEATMERVTAELLDDGVFANGENIRPARFDRPGETVAIEIRRDEGWVWHIGKRAPPEAERASRPVTVDVPSGRYPAQLVVWVWES